jgi:hypothetical protein
MPDPHRCTLSILARSPAACDNPLAARTGASRRRRYNAKTMTDPFELWRLMWSTAMSRGLETLAEVAANAAALKHRHQANSVGLSSLATLQQIRIELHRALARAA